MPASPNILLITCDQLQAFATGCYGNPDVRTPGIDALAASGVRFEYGISNAPVCMAARSLLLSGQHNRRCTGGVGNVQYPCGKRGSYPMPEYPPPTRMHLVDPTLPELLRDAGYDTAVIGKWHIYAWPDAIGFNHYLIPRTHHVHSAQGYVEDGSPEFVPDGYSVDFETRRAVEFLHDRQHARQPFFLMLNYSPPHPPLNDCPEPYLTMYDPASMTLRPNVNLHKPFPDWDHDCRVYRWDYRYYELQLPHTLRPREDSIRDIYAAYYGNTTWLDTQIARVLHELEACGLREDTMVVFTADHGDNLGSHGRNGKGLPFDESLRVPMILSRPGTLEPAVVTDRVATLLDLAPTLLGHAGVTAPAHFDGLDLLTHPDDPQPAASEAADHPAICEITPGTLVARTTRFTAFLDADRNQPLAFYDNHADPYQMTNLADTPDHADVQRRLFARLRRHHRDVPITPQPDYGFTRH